MALKSVEAYDHSKVGSWNSEIIVCFTLPPFILPSLVPTLYVCMYINEPSKPTNTTTPFAEPHPPISH